MIISEMQSKLAHWSTEQPNRRFDRLLRLITNRDWLDEAARMTLAGNGARTPGVDGMTKHRWEVNAAAELAQLRVELLDGSYRPQPARRVYIPKPNGAQRPLGIPCLRDRIVQRAMLMAMDPIWENDFLGVSYGFRPGRSVHHAVRSVKLALTDKVRGAAELSYSVGCRRVPRGISCGGIRPTIPTFNGMRLCPRF